MTAPHAETRLGTGAGAPDLSGGATRLAERALLAALLYQPDRMADLDRWLRDGDFADPHHAAVYRTVAGLRTAGELQPVSATGSNSLAHDARSAIAANVLAVQRALHAGRFAPVPPPHAGVRELLGAAPTNGPDLHVRYGQMVLASSARRRMQTWGVRFEQLAGVTPTHGDEATRDLSSTYHALLTDVDDLQRRTAQSAISREMTAFTGPAEMDTSVPDGPLVVPAAAPAAKLVQRAERDVLAAVLADETGQHNDVRFQLEPGDFTASPRHATTWRAIQAVARRGEPVNAITVAWETEHLPAEPGSALSAEELVALAGAQPPSSLRRQTATIARASLYHRVQHTAGHLAGTAQDRARSVDEMLKGARLAARNLREQATRLADEHIPGATPSTIAQRLDGPSEPAARQR